MLMLIINVYCFMNLTCARMQFIKSQNAQAGVSLSRQTAIHSSRCSLPIILIELEVHQEIIHDDAKRLQRKSMNLKNRLLMTKGDMP